MTTTKTARFTIMINLLAIGLIFVQPRLADARQESSQGSSSGPLIAGPNMESVRDTFTFVSWTTLNPGGTILHFAIVHYGKDPNHLDLTAKYPTRINPSHSQMVFRARIDGLEPGTTYYYKVSSEQATGVPDPATSGVHLFTTRATNEISVNK